MVDQTSGAIRGEFRRVSRPILDLPRPYSVETRDEPKGSVLRFAPGVLGFIFLAWLTLPALLTGGRDRGAPEGQAAPAALPMWQEMPGAAPAFVLDAPMLAGNAVAFSARHHTKGGREDIFTLGAAGGPHARMVAYRPGDEAGSGRHLLPGDGTACRRSRLRGDAERVAVRGRHAFWTCRGGGRVADVGRRAAILPCLPARLGNGRSADVGMAVRRRAPARQDAARLLHRPAGPGAPEPPTCCCARPSRASPRPALRPARPRRAAASAEGNISLQRHW